MTALKAGDIIGFSGNDWLSAVINVFTYGIPYYNIAHVGIIAQYDPSDPYPIYSQEEIYDFDARPGLYMFESVMANNSFCMPPCAFRGKYTDGVQAHYMPNMWGLLARRKGRIWHYPLCRKLRPLESRRLTNFLLRNLGARYDAIGAFRAAGLGFSWVESLLRKEDLTSIFCSELCAAAHRHVGIFDTNNASFWNPNRFVRAERRNGILERPVRIQ